MFFEFIRYNIVGIINSIVGFSIIFILMLFGINAIISNAVGYGIGSIVSFYLNRKYTFKSTLSGKLIIFKFFTALAISYELNFIMLTWLLGIINPYLAQIVAGATYTISSFLLIKFFIFNN
jgi:putative flippase GtrA